MPRLAEVVACNDITQRFALLAKLGSISSLWNDSAKPSKGTLRTSVISRTIHNADSECIDKLFQMFGLTEQVCNGEIDVWDDELEIEQSDDIRTRLKDIVKCRNDIAHGDMDRRPTRDDVRRYLIFLTHFSRRLDRKQRQLIERYESFAASS